MSRVVITNVAVVSEKVHRILKPHGVETQVPHHPQAPGGTFEGQSVELEEQDDWIYKNCDAEELHKERVNRINA